MKDNKQFILNIIAVGSFILYGIGIYLYVTILNEDWGNIAIDFAIQLVGPLVGVILVIIIGSIILLLSYYIQKLKHTNVLLCWFWIFSLYQCTINTFLQVSGRPDEPINQFFKAVFPSFWYPAKEIFFLAISLVLTYFWVKKISKEDFTKWDSLLIALASLILVGGTVISQIFLMN
ncbi:MAG: hypothetical protein HWN66_10355 [Candidatus Helarchaeota archaeon]|nr:hypothetical protein [Candidatus Helarchaeota archaeon]